MSIQIIIKHRWFHKLFRTQKWKYTRVAEKILELEDKKTKAEVGEAMFNLMLYGKADLPGGVEIELLCPQVKNDSAH